MLLVVLLESARKLLQHFCPLGLGFSVALLYGPLGLMPNGITELLPDSQGQFENNDLDFLSMNVIGLRMESLRDTRMYLLILIIL